jgi:glycerol-1-phosphate dehydrogenase [NAD(P)+]
MAGVKEAVASHAPMAVFAGLKTLCEAPGEMIGAGFGDMIGKFTSLADWKLGALLLDERYDAQIARRMQQALHACVSRCEDIGRASPLGIRALMRALFESLLCMAEYGGSRPASGAEHLLSHFWEMRLRRDGMPAILHGARVGVGTVLAAERWDAIGSLTQREVVARLAATHLPS